MGTPRGKLRLLLNALRASTGAKVAFILGAICAALVAGGIFYLLAILGGGLAAADLTTAIFCLFGLTWLILPIVAFGLDSTLDPATPALDPLRTRPLAVGLLAASATGAWPAATLIGLLGVTVGLARGAHAGTAVLLLVLLAGIIVVLGLLWIRSLARSLVTTDTSTQSAVHGSALPFARYGLRGTVAARLWLYQRREPAALIYWGLTLVIMAVVGARAALTPDYLGGLLASAAVGGAFTGAFHANAIGMSGPGFGLEAAALNGRRALRAYFAGQNLALGVVAVHRWSRRSVSDSPRWPSTRWPASWAWRSAWPGSARVWPWPTCSASRWSSRWKSGRALPCPGRSAGTTARASHRGSSA